MLPTNLLVKKRRPINKKEARKVNQGLFETHKIDFSIKAGSYESAQSNEIGLIIRKGYIFALVFDSVYHLSVRGLLSHSPNKGWVQVDMGAVPYVCNGANIMSAGINSVSPEIVEGQYVWVREENHHKPLAIGKSISNADSLINSREGKAIETLHYIGDKIWTYGEKE